MLEAGFARTEITFPGEMHLIGVYAKEPRLGTRVRDPLFARAVALGQGARRLLIVAADLLCVSEELARAVVADLAATEGGFDPAELILLGTHSHASYGGFFSSSAVAPMLGAHRPEVFAFLRARLVEVARAALADRAPARASCGRTEVRGLTSSRRQADGPRDDDLLVLRLERPDRRPIDLINLSGHPVVVSERDPHAVSADYPGELCARAEAAGAHGLVFHAALGGVSILFPEFAMDQERHLDLLGGLLERGYQEAVAAATPLPADATLSVERWSMEHPPHQSRIFSPLGGLGRLADLALAPLYARLARAGAAALPFEHGVPLHLIRLGRWGLVASACELGVSVVLGIRAWGREVGLPSCQVASLANGYAGYIHTRETYRRLPERGYRMMALYENALAMFGHDFGDRILAELRRRAG